MSWTRTAMMRTTVGALVACTLTACTTDPVEDPTTTVATTSTTTTALPDVEAPWTVVREDRSVVAIGDDDIETEVRPPSSDPFSPQAVGSPDGRSIAWSESGAVSWTNPTGHSTATLPFTPFFHLWSPDGSHILSLGAEPDGGDILATLTDTATMVATSLESATPFFGLWTDPETLYVHAADTTLLRFDSGDGTGERLDIEASGFSAADVLSDGRLVLGIPGAGDLSVSNRRLPVQAANGTDVVAFDPSTGDTEVLYEAEGRVSFAVGADDLLAVIDAAVPVPIVAGPLLIVQPDGETIELGVEVVLTDWSPDRRTLLFAEVAGQSLRYSVWDGVEVRVITEQRPSPLFLGEYLPFWEQYQRSLSLWAPDGSGFAVATADGDIVIHPLDGSDPTTLTTGSFASTPRRTP